MRSAIRSDTPAWLSTIAPACAAIAALLTPYGEVVVHELATDRIVAIWNGFSGRKVGDPALLEDLPDSLPPGGVYGPHEKVLVDGRRISSVSAIVVDAAGVACGLLCVNLDRSPLDSLTELLSAFAAPVQPRPPELFNRAWNEQIALAVDQECREAGLRRDALTRADRKAIVASLNARGLFETRNAAEHAARALRTSRATVYTLLKEVRADRNGD
ncbi:MAG TPA: PAS domain-containing protein [Streptosporangiaceae bacterium]|nr:PAS domain-containing protein [Streptosporangiaceae bacterium]